MRLRSLTLWGFMAVGFMAAAHAATPGQGSVMVRTDAGWSALAPGTAGSVLYSGGLTGNPFWGSVPSLLGQDFATAMRTATGATTPRSLGDAAADVLQGADNGLKCDGVTDDGPALQALVNRVSATTSPDIQLPYGKCLINTSVTISLAPVHIKGHGWGEANSPGTKLYTTNPAISPIYLTGYHATAGTSIEDVALSQLQPPPAVGWTPTVYPAFISVNGSPGVRLRRILGFGVYDGFYLHNAGRYEVSDIYGQFFHRGMTADTGYDLAHIFNWHAWPFWLDSMNATLPNPARDAVIAWQQANSDLIALGRQDGATIRDVFAFAVNGGVSFIPDAAGAATNIMIDELQCDSNVHCLKNVSGQGASIYLGRMNSFGQRGVDSGTPYPGANAIYADANSAFNIAGGDIKQGFPDTNVVQLDSTTLTSALYLHSVQTYLMAGAAGSSIFKLSYAGTGSTIVNVDTPLNIALTSGGYMAGVNWGSTNAAVRIPGLDYQIVENPTAVAFAGNSYAIENARPKIVFEADDGNTISSMTIRMPRQPYDGMEVVIMSTVQINGLTINDPNGRPIIIPPTSLAPYSPVRFKWTNTGSQIVWFRI